MKLPKAIRAMKRPKNGRFASLEDLHAFYDGWEMFWHMITGFGIAGLWLSLYYRCGCQ